MESGRIKHVFMFNFGKLAPKMNKVFWRLAPVPMTFWGCGVSPHGQETAKTGKVGAKQIRKLCVQLLGVFFDR